MRHSFLYRNGLSLFFIMLFLGTLLLQAIAGWKVHNQELEDAGRAATTFASYLGTGHFISATFENFQSEFLQMGMYVMVTVFLRQQGSAESKQLAGKEEVERKPRATKDAPWPVKKGGWILRLYSSSLSIAFFVLFFVTWGLHLYGSFLSHNEERLLNNKAAYSLLEFAGQPDFWFETFQNWQSEFLSVAAIVVLTIFLRQKGSPESKPVDAPDRQTGK